MLRLTIVVLIQSASLLFLPERAAAELVSMACEFLDGSRGGSYASRVDRIVYSLDENYFEFSVAKSVGTTAPVNYLFSNSQGDQLVLSRRQNDGTVVAGGVRFGTPFSIRLDGKTGILVWQYIDGVTPEHSIYRCRH